MNVEGLAQAVQQYGTLRERAGLGNARSGMTAETVYNNIVEDLKQLEKQIAALNEEANALRDLQAAYAQLAADMAKVEADNDAWREAIVKNNALIKDLRQVETAAQKAYEVLRGQVG